MLKKFKSEVKTNKVKKIENEILNSRCVEIKKQYIIVTDRIQIQPS